MIYAIEYGVVFWVVFLIPGVFYLLAIRALSPVLETQNRKFKDWTIWICLVPVIGALWLPITATEVSRSLGAEYKSRGGSAAPDSGYGAAIVILIVTIVGMATPGLAILTIPITLIAWALNWSAVWKGKKHLAAPIVSDTNAVG